MPGRAISVPVAGTPMNSPTWVPVIVNRIVAASPLHSTSWNSSGGGSPKAAKIAS